MASKKKTAVMLSPRNSGLSKAARELLSRVRVAVSPETIFGLEPAVAAARVQGVVGPMIEGAGLPVALLQEYRWYVAELCRLMRTVSGPDLAYCMERAIRKWLSLGLEPNTVVYLAEALFDRLAGKPDSENPESRIQSAESSVDGPETKSEGRSQSAEGRSAEEERIQPQRHEETKGISPNGETGAELTTKTPRHQEDSGAGTGPLDSSNPGTLPTDDGRRTSNEQTSGGGGP
jgi:hypothetical protein